MFKSFNKRLKRLCRHLRRRFRRSQRHSTAEFPVTKAAENSQTAIVNDVSLAINGSSLVHPRPENPIRLATFNAALFSMAPAVPKSVKGQNFDRKNPEFTIMPKSILKQSPLHHMNGATDNSSLSRKQQNFAKSKLRVSINLPDNEISRQLNLRDFERYDYGMKSPIRSSTASSETLRSKRTVLEVLQELNADVLALQDVKAEEEKDMKPLSDLAAALGMNYVFAESWAPEYGNAVLSKWPIKNWRVQKIFDDSDFRNVLKATIDVPQTGELEIHCTHLDHLDENWRMKQINAVIQSGDGPHILAGGLNSLDESDYSSERWTDIVKYYEEIGKPTPRAEVMRFLKNKQYTDAKEFAGECESVVVVAKGQSVQGTCKYGTRMDYILASADLPYKFVPGSYSVFSSKGTSDHHIVTVDMIKMNRMEEENVGRKKKQKKQRLVKISANSPSHIKGIWKTPT